MTDMEKRAAAKAFAADWKGRGDEKQETQSFWMALLQKVFGVAEPDKYIEFEVRVKLSHTSFIDGLIKSTRVLIEQKGQDIDLRKGYKQSDGSMLTPYQQARRYAGYLPHDQNPRWIIVCNFQEFHIHDMNRPNDAPEVVLLADLEKEYHRLNFLVDMGDENIKREMEISMQAGELVGKLYDAFVKQYKDPTNDRTLKSLNMLCVRLVFCLYAEDAGIFGKPHMFHDFLRSRGMQNGRRALRDLFRVLDQKLEDRDPYLADDDPLLAAFPYVNGGLFSDEDIEIPPFNEEIYNLLLNRASEDFNWSDISPTIFGAVFESTLNPETRRKGGMHYTSIENIHKVIDPLFMDDLYKEWEEARGGLGSIAQRNKRFLALQEKLASLVFLDPACGSGNFLTETYLCLRKLENEILKELYGGQIMMGAAIGPIKVSIGQFYGIEINDFAATVAKTALWIAESQMMKRTEDIVHMDLNFLPLKGYINIVEGNALRIDWESVVSKEKLNYIMGNPPFVAKAGRTSAKEAHSAAMMSVDQKSDKELFFGKNAGLLDYVACWYKKAAEYTKDTSIVSAFVSTSSICQGQQVEPLWGEMLKDDIYINFAHTNFKWASEAGDAAYVFVVIVGFSHVDKQKCLLFSGNQVKTVKHISPYLIEGEDVLVETRNKPISDVPVIGIGNKPIDGGNYLFKPDEMDAFIRLEPSSKDYFRAWYGAEEFINNKRRYCLWLGDCSPSKLKAMPECYKRVQAVREFRLNSKSDGTRRIADKPTRFHVENMPLGNFIVIPEVSSGARRYIPIGYMDDSVLCGNTVRLMPDATLYHFGVLTSNVHMAWMRTVGGYFGPSYRYSVNVVYNNFPWPTPTDAQKTKIEQTAQAILDARALYPDCSLADLYDEVTMPPELRKAHQQNDKAVMEAYGMPVRETTEASCVAELMRRYQELTKQ